MRISLISPYPSLEAFGLRTISACLKKAGHEVRLIFLPQEFDRPYEPAVLEELVQVCRDSDLVGLSVMSNFRDNARQLTRALRCVLGTTVVWGGIHPTVLPRECLAEADLVCLGEAEETMVELAARMAAGQDFHRLPGLWAREGERIIENPLRPLIQDLSSLPWPDYDLEDHLLLFQGRIRAMDQDLLRQEMGTAYVTMPSRGCPFGCAYCVNSTLKKLYPDQKMVRSRDLEGVVEELKQAKAGLPFIDRIKFDDDAFFLAYGREEMARFCRRYKDEVGLPLAVTGVTPATMDEAKLADLVEAGLDFVRVGIQSGAERTRKLYRRGHTDEQIRSAASSAHLLSAAGRPPQYDIILDNPWEREGDLVETLLLLSRLPTPFQLCLFSLNLYPGTELHLKAREEGLIKDEEAEIFRKHYNRVSPTYLNRLFILLDQVAFRGGRISPFRMRLLTDPRLRRVGLSRILFYLVRFWESPVPVRVRYLVRAGLRDLLRGDWRRMGGFLKRLVTGLRSGRA